MNALEKIKKIKVVPVIVINDQGNAEKLAESLINGGLPVAEVTFRTPAAENAIKRMTAYSPDILVGAGTVINAEQAERAVAAGADFIVSPGLSESVADYCRQKKRIVYSRLRDALRDNEGNRLRRESDKILPCGRIRRA